MPYQTLFEAALTQKGKAVVRRHRCWVAGRQIFVPLRLVNRYRRHALSLNDREAVEGLVEQLEADLGDLWHSAKDLECRLARAKEAKP